MLKVAKKKEKDDLQTVRENKKTIESDYFSSFSFSSTTSSDHSKPELVSCAINQYRENIGNKKIRKRKQNKKFKIQLFSCLKGKKIRGRRVQIGWTRFL